MQKIIKFDKTIEGKIECRYYLEYNYDEHTIFGRWIDKEEKECIIAIVEGLNKLNRCHIQIIDNTCENPNKYLQENEKTIKLDFHSSDGDRDLFNKYVNVLHKYSINNNIILTKDEFDWNHAIIEVKSLEVIPELEHSFRAVSTEEIAGLIFSTVDENHYSIEIYDGYRE